MSEAAEKLKPAVPPTPAMRTRSGVLSEAAEKLKPVLAALPAADRVEIIEYLVALHDGEDISEDEWEAEWVEEINRRIEDATAGRSDSMPHEEFMRQMKEKYG